MDVNTIRIIVTVMALATFLGIVVWAWSSRRHADFDAASRLVLDDGDGEQRQERER